VRPPKDSAYLAVVHGDNPTKIGEKALVALGGIERFVKPGDNVIIKPNICVSYRSFEYAATTNPEVVGALTSMSLNAGAKGVRVMDNSARALYLMSYCLELFQIYVLGAGSVSVNVLLKENQLFVYPAEILKNRTIIGTYRKEHRHLTK